MKKNAKDMGDTLKSLGFEVIPLQNAGKKQMVDAVILSAPESAVCRAGAATA